MTDKVEITSIIVRVGGKEGQKLKLTLEEAKSLQALLNKELGNDTYIPYYPVYPGPSYTEITWQGDTNDHQTADRCCAGTLWGGPV